MCHMKGNECITVICYYTMFAVIFNNAALETYILMCKLEMTMCTAIYIIGGSVTWNTHCAPFSSNWLTVYPPKNEFYTAPVTQINLLCFEK